MKKRTNFSDPTKFTDPDLQRQFDEFMRRPSSADTRIKLTRRPDTGRQSVDDDLQSEWVIEQPTVGRPDSVVEPEPTAQAAPVVVEPVPLRDTPATSATVEPKPVKRTGGNRRGSVWDEAILPCLAAKVKTGGPFIDEQAAVAAARGCLAADPKKRELSPDALVKGTRKWCPPDWIATNKPAPGN
jgi:hypothetical protein